MLDEKESEGILKQIIADVDFSDRQAEAIPESIKEEEEE